MNLLAKAFFITFCCFILGCTPGARNFCVGGLCSSLENSGEHYQQENALCYPYKQVH